MIAKPTHLLPAGLANLYKKSWQACLKLKAKVPLDAFRRLYDRNTHAPKLDLPTSDCSCPCAANAQMAVGSNLSRVCPEIRGSKSKGVSGVALWLYPLLGPYPQPYALHLVQETIG